MDRQDDIHPLSEMTAQQQSDLRQRLVSWLQDLQKIQEELQALQRVGLHPPDVSAEKASLWFSGNQWKSVQSMLFQPVDVRIPFHGESPRVEVLHRIVAEIVGGLYAPVREQSHAFVYLLQGDRGHIRVALGAIPTKHSLTSTAMGSGVFRAALPGARTRVYRGQHPISGEGHLKEMLAPLYEFKHWALMLGAPRIGLFGKERQFFSPDVILRGMADERFAYLVVAQPMSEEQIQDALIEVIERISAVFSTIEAQINVGESESFGRSTPYLDLKKAIEIVSTIRQLALLFENPAFLTMAVSKAIGTEQAGRAESRGLNLRRLNQAAKFYYQMLLSLARRLLLARDEGMWQVSVYLATENASALNKLQGLVRMNFSRHLAHSEEDWNEPIQTLPYPHAHYAAQQLSVITLSTKDVLPNHPLSSLYPWALTTPLLTEEVAALANLPTEEYPGYRVREENQFSVFVEEAQLESGPRITLGPVFTRGELLERVSLEIPVHALTGHTLVAGVTGSGKTTTTQSLLLQLAQQGIPFLVIEPAKAEYRALLEPLKEQLQIFTLGNETIAPFRINPFEVLSGTHVQTHIDLLKDLIITAFSMWGPLPQLIEWALLETYKQRGWDLVRGYNPYDPESTIPSLTPTLDDFYYNLVRAADHFGYIGEVRSNIEAALLARVDSLRRGAKGAMLNVRRSIPMEMRLSRPTILELKHIGDDNDKAFLIGLLLIRLYEWLESRPQRSDSGQLKHLLVIEEAHRLFRNVSGSTVSADGERMGDPRAKAVETFSNIMSEVRAYGEGLIIIDQIPSRLAPDAVKNTNIRIIHRLVARDDRDYIGLSINLEPHELDFLIGLPRGQVLFHREGMVRPAHVQVTPAGRFLSPTDDEVREYMAQHFPQRQYLLRHPGCAYCRRPCLFYAQSDMVLSNIRDVRERLGLQWLLAAMLAPPHALGLGARHLVMHFKGILQQHGLAFPMEELEDVFWCTLWKDILPFITSLEASRGISPPQLRHQHDVTKALAELFHTTLEAHRRGFLSGLPSEYQETVEEQRKSVLAALQYLLNDECARQEKPLAGWLSRRIHEAPDISAFENIPDGMRWAVRTAIAFWRESGGMELMAEGFLDPMGVRQLVLDLAYCIVWRYLVETTKGLRTYFDTRSGEGLKASIIQRLGEDLPGIFEQEWHLFG